MKKTMLLVLVAMMALGSVAFAKDKGKDKEAANPNEGKNMYLAVAGTISSPPNCTVNGASSTTGNGVGGGMNLMFNYNVWTYIGVGADMDITGWDHSANVKSSVDIAISPTVKGFYNFAPQGLPGLEVYGRFGFGYARIINPTKGVGDWNAFALKFMVGAAYDILDSGLFALGEFGVTHRTFKQDIINKSFTTRADAFTFGLGAGYRF